MAPRIRSLVALWPYLLLLLVGSFVLLPGLGEFGFWDPWEPRYAQSAREMLERDSYLVPYYRGEIRMAKPILVYWSILAGSAVFGLNEFGARIGGVVAALASMLGVYYAVATLRGRRAGLFAALVLVTLPQFYLLSRQATPDVYLFTSLGSCILFLCLGLFGPLTRRTVHLVVAYACFALAVLAKGPIIPSAIVLVALAVWAVASADLSALARPELGSERIRLRLVGFSTAALVAAFTATAYLFAVPSDWWGFSELRRRLLRHVHERLGVLAEQWRWPEIALVLTAATAVLMAAWLGRRHARKPRSARGTTVLLAVMVLAAATVLAAWIGFRLDDPASRIVYASCLSAVAAACIMAAAIWRFATLPELWPVFRPRLERLGRQALLFLAVNAAIAGPWYLGVILTESDEFVHDFVIYNHLQRVTENISETGASDFYLRVLLFGFFPWSCLLPVALAVLVDWWKPNVLRRYGFEVFLIIAVTVTVVAFTASVTKFNHYIAPVLLPVAALVGLALDRLMASGPWLARLSSIVASLLFMPAALDVAGPGGISYLLGAISVRRAVPSSLEPGPLFSALLLLLGLALLGSLVARSKLLMGGLVLTAVLLAHYVNAVFIPAVSPHKTMKGLCETWKRHTASGGEGAYYGGVLKHGVFFYCDADIRVLNRENFEDFMSPDKPAVCLVERRPLGGLLEAYRSRYPGHELRVIDESHFEFAVVSNR